jgi:mannose-6-phosphate isomerase-like protein (cupin superfamily)
MEEHMAFNEDIVKKAKANTNFRAVLSTGPNAQVVVMSIPPGGDIGEETHSDVDQILVFVGGEGQAVLDGKKSAVGPDRLVHVPAGTRHNFINTGKTDLRLYTIYAPPEHKPGIVRKTKADAMARPE